MSKFADLVNAHYKEIAEKLTELYRDVLECDGRLQETLYIWDDGEMQVLEDVQGGNTYWMTRDPDRELYCVACIEESCFDWKDYTDYHSLPDPDECPDEYEQRREETIDWLVDEFDPASVIENSLRDDEIYEEMRIHA